MKAKMNANVNGKRQTIYVPFQEANPLMQPAVLSFFRRLDTTDFWLNAFQAMA
jgi:hypothetical protein